MKVTARILKKRTETAFDSYSFLNDRKMLQTVLFLTNIKSNPHLTIMQNTVHVIRSVKKKKKKKTLVRLHNNCISAKPWSHLYIFYTFNSAHLKGPFHDAEIFLWHCSEDSRQNKLISKFPVNLEVAFESYARFTVLHLLYRPLHCIFFMST